MVIFLLFIGRVFDMHRMAGCGAGNRPIFSNREPFAVHFRRFADTVVNPDVMASPAEGHMVGAQLPLHGTTGEKTFQLIPGEHMTYSAIFPASVGITLAVSSFSSCSSHK